MTFSEFWQNFYIKYISYGIYQEELTKNQSATFGVFSKYHFISTSLGILFIILFFKLTKNFSSNRLMRHQKRISFIMLILEILRMIWFIVYRHDKYFIRFDYCNQVCLFMPILILFGAKNIYPFLSATAFLGGAGVLVYPLHVFSDYGGFHIMSIQSMISHTLMVLSSINLVRCHVTNTKKDFKQTYLLFFIMALISFTFSLIRNVNYMAMLSPEGLPLINKVPAPFHIIFVIGAIDLGFYLFFLVEKKVEKYLLCPDIKEKYFKEETVLYEI